MKFPTKKGYSLVELTIVVGLVAILAVAISSIVLMSVVQSNRIRAEIRTRQAGDYAITQLQTMIRNSRVITACDSSANELTILNPDGGTTTFAAELSESATRIASNSGIYLTPSDVSLGNSFDIECSPSDASAKLISVSFDLDISQDTGRDLETPPIHFSTSIEQRNN